VFLNVIIPSYRSSETIGRTLKSILANRETFPGEFDITVVDSTEPGPPETNALAEAIAGSGAEVSLIRLPKRAYPGAARNRGVEAARGDILCFIDADAYADTGWLQAIHSYMENNPDVGALGGPVLNANPSVGYSRLAHWCEFSGYGPHAPEGPRRVQPTVNVAVRRSVFEKHGPFLEDQFGNEDVLLFARMMLAGEKLHFNRAVRVFHRNKTELKDIHLHQRRLGECTGRARAMYDLPGSFLTRPGGSLLVPLVKTHFIGWRLLTQETQEYPGFLVSWPRVFSAMCHFACGFAEGVQEAAEGKNV